MTQHPNPQRTHRPGATVRLVISATCLVACFESTPAQQDGQVTIDAARCRKIESPEERLACFEAQVDGARAAGRNEPESPAADGAASQPAIRTVEVRPPPQPVSTDEPAQREYVGTITSLRTRAPNRYVIGLDNGQVWEQRVAERYLLRVGQRVRIYGTRWGSSQRLEADGLKGFIQVQRVL